MLYVFLCGGFPAVVQEDERERHRRHTLVGAFDDPFAAWAVYDELRDAAIERIRRTGRPNLPSPPPGPDGPPREFCSGRTEDRARQGSALR